MKRQTSLSRIRTQLSALERMLRILRSEVENQISAFSPDDIETTVEVENGLTNLFLKGQAIAAVAPQAYDHFAPDVWVGMDMDVGDCGASVAVKVLHPHDPLDSGARAARISINPIFPLVEKPRWMTLETKVDLDGLRNLKGLRVDMISFFDISPRNTDNLPRHVSLTLRMKCFDGSNIDCLNYRVPVSTMPFEHSMIMPADGLKEVDFGKVSGASFIIALPLAGIFTYHLDHFSVKSIGV